MSAPSPLSGLRVVDLSQNLAGPYATQILADFGADVIKVEPPGGDPARAWGPPFVGGESPLFLCGNRGKRSVVLDLNAERDREALRRLTARSHVFVQAFRAGVIERLGFDYDAVRRLRPGIVYVSVTAFGAGPLQDQPGYDPLMQAYAGIMSVTGHPGAPPTRVGTSLVDMGTGMWAAMAVLAELAARGWPVQPAPETAPEGAAERRAESAPSRALERTHSDRPSHRESTHITTALLDTAVAWMAYHLQGYLGTGDVPGPMGSGLGLIAPYQAVATADGHVMIAAGNDAIFGRLCRALDLPELEQDARFRRNSDRVEHRDELIAALEARTRRRTTAEVLSSLREAGVPSAPIQDVAQVAEDAQVAASDMLRSSPAGRSSHVDVALPVRWDGQRAPPSKAPPAVGQHTAAILAELGLDEG